MIVEFICPACSGRNRANVNSQTRIRCGACGLIVSAPEAIPARYRYVCAQLNATVTDTGVLHAAGLDETVAAAWLTAVGTVNHAVGWWRAGVISPTDAEIWTRSGVTPLQASEWTATGVEQAASCRLVDAGFDAAEEWQHWKAHDIKEGEEFAILTNIIHQEWSDLTVKDHKNLKGLERQNLRDHMSEAELIFTALAELSTRQIAETMDANGLPQNKIAGKIGGNIAKNARLDLEEKTGKSVVTGHNFLPPKKENPMLPL